MKRISISSDQSDVNLLLQAAREDDILAVAADGAGFLISRVNDFDLEIVRTRRNAELMSFLDERGSHPATMTLEELKAEFGLND